MAGLAASTLARTAYEATYLIGCRMVSDMGRIFLKIKTAKNYGEAFYPRAAFLMNCAALIESGWLYGLIYKEVESITDVNSWYGSAFFAGNMTALFLLVYNAMRETVIDTILDLSARRSKDPHIQKTYKLCKNIEEEKKTIVSMNLQELLIKLKDAHLEENEIQFVTSNIQNEIRKKITENWHQLIAGEIDESTIPLMS